MQIGSMRDLVVNALIDPLRNWALPVVKWLSLVTRASRAGQSPPAGKSGDEATTAGAPLEGWPIAHRARSGPPADWLERVRRGAPDLLVPGRIGVMRVPGWARPGPDASPDARRHASAATPFGNRIGDADQASAGPPAAQRDAKESETVEGHEVQPPPGGGATTDGRASAKPAFEIRSPLRRPIAGPPLVARPAMSREQPRPPHSSSEPLPGPAGRTGLVAPSSATTIPPLRLDGSAPPFGAGQRSDASPGGARSWPAAENQGAPPGAAHDVEPDGPAPPASARIQAPDGRFASHGFVRLDGGAEPSRARPDRVKHRWAPVPRPDGSGGAVPAWASLAYPIVDQVGDRRAATFEPSLASRGSTTAPFSVPFDVAEPGGRRSGLEGTREDPWPALPEEPPEPGEDGAALLRSWERLQRLDREQRGVGWNA
jgi:hypothetical protein